MIEDVPSLDTVARRECIGNYSALSECDENGATYAATDKIVYTLVFGVLVVVRLLLLVGWVALVEIFVVVL